MKIFHSLLKKWHTDIFEYFCCMYLQKSENLFACKYFVYTKKDNFKMKSCLYLQRFLLNQWYGA